MAPNRCTCRPLSLEDCSFCSEGVDPEEEYSEKWDEDYMSENEDKADEGPKEFDGIPSSVEELSRSWYLKNFERTADTIDGLAHVMAAPHFDRKARPFIKDLWMLSDSVRGFAKKLQEQGAVERKAGQESKAS